MIIRTAGRDLKQGDYVYMDNDDTIKIVDVNNDCVPLGIVVHNTKKGESVTIALPQEEVVIKLPDVPIGAKGYYTANNNWETYKNAKFKSQEYVWAGVLKVGSDRAIVLCELIKRQG